MKERTISTKFLTSVWSRLTSLAKDNGKCHVAVAYFGQGASQMLPLRAGSTLVVNMSLRTVEEGSTSPAEVGKMLKRRVAVYTCKKLHAKVFVMGDRAIVGSSNASLPSRSSLIEAALETNDPTAVQKCTAFVKQHCSTKVNPKDVEKLLPFYNPSGGGGKRNSSTGQQLTFPPFWAVALSRVDWDEEDTQQADKARPLAENDLGDPKKYRLDEFCWTGHDLRARLSEKDLIVQVMTENDRSVKVHPPSEVIRIQQYHVGKSPRMIVFLRVPRRSSVDLKRLGKLIDAPIKSIKKLRRVRLLKNQKLITEFASHWGINAGMGRSE